MKNSPKGYLILEGRSPGEVLEYSGYLFGAPPSADLIRSRLDKGYGEVVFNTSMTGYQEILTDPSYFGEIVCMTTPHIGNTGINTEDPESSKVWCAGFVINELSNRSSNWRTTGELDEYLKVQKVPGIHGIDTRALTRELRSGGVLRGIILPENEIKFAKELLSQLPSFEGRDMIREVSTPQAYRWSKGDQKSRKYKVVTLDFGLKWNLLRSLEEFDCDVEVVPADTSADEILKLKPNGVFLSNGPGDPAAAGYAIETVRNLIGKVPIFGVCMGHQILALATGAKTYKLKFGHRGGNQPVLDYETKKVEISSHNHGYAVDEKSIPPSVKVTHINLNDRTVEGLALPDQRAFSVQYHPEACPGPHDSVQLFKRFVDLMG